MRSTFSWNIYLIDRYIRHQQIISPHLSRGQEKKGKGEKRWDAFQMSELAGNFANSELINHLST